MRRTWLRTLWLGIALVGCRKDDPQTTKASLVLDNDGDGYAVTVDCDDNNPLIFPNAEEICDGIDNDCDAAVDEAVGFAYFADADGDGHGDPEAPIVACQVGNGVATLGDDCDDTDPSVYPSADEQCDAIDNDCDNEIDEGALLTWYLDSDNDGYGDPSTEIAECTAPEGYVADNTDCDDADPERAPGLAEVCDNKDNDCDNDIDSTAIDRIEWWPDFDNDGYGNPDQASLLSCTAPLGQVSNNLDCVDTNAAIYPGAPELCDTIDNNCDTIVDDVDADLDGTIDIACQGGTDCDDSDGTIYPGAIDTWYDGVDQDCDRSDDYDADQDGFVPDGYEGLPTRGLSGTGNLPNGDCDDTLPTVHPGVSDVWYDGVDQNCDSQDDYDQDADGFVPDIYVGLPTVYLPTSGGLPGGDCNDAAGAIFPGAPDAWYDGIDQNCDQADDFDRDTDGYVPDAYAGRVTVDVPGSGSLPAGDCDDDDPTIYPFAVDLWYDGVDQDCDGANDYDRDGDGYAWDAYGGDDCNDDDPNIHPGEPEVCDDDIDQDCDGTSNACSFVDDVPLTDGDAWFYGESAAERVGQGDPGITNGGDLNGDGWNDLVVSAIFDDTAGTNAGIVHVFYGPVSGQGLGVSVSDAKITGEAAGDLFGRSVVSAKDFDNDGFDDLFISAQGTSTKGASTGTAYVVSGPITAGTFGVVTSGLADRWFVGAAAGDLIADLAPAGDVNGDGYDDLLIAAQFWDEGGTDAGGAYLIYGPSTAGEYDLASVRSTDARLIGVRAGDEAGSSVAGGVDLSGDGFPDLLVAARYADAGTRTDNGAVYVVHGPVSGDLDLVAADGRFIGEASADELGYGAGVGLAGDVNDDGYEDFIAGARFNGRGGTKAGTAYLLLGPITTGTNRSVATADGIFVGEAASDQTGDSVSGVGDVDGDGNIDLLIGSGWVDAGTSNGGAGYLVLGPFGATTGVLDLSKADARFIPEGDNDRVRISAGGDMNADGNDDLLFATQNNSTNLSTAGSQHGAVYLFYGKGL